MDDLPVVVLMTILSGISWGLPGVIACILIVIAVERLDG